MPDVLHEAARTGYDDAIEVKSDCGDVVGITTFAVDRYSDGTTTGHLDGLPIRVYVMPEDEPLAVKTAWLDMDAAYEMRDALDAALMQVELTRDHRRRHPAAGFNRTNRPEGT